MFYTFLSIIMICMYMCNNITIKPSYSISWEPEYIEHVIGSNQKSFELDEILFNDLNPFGKELIGLRNDLIIPYILEV